MGAKEPRIEERLAACAPAVAALGTALRDRLRARLPGLHEVVYVYERQEALILSYSPTEKGYEGVVSLGVYPDRVQLSFPRGERLASADPAGLLRGRGPGVRHVVLRSAAEFDRPEIEALLAATLALAGVVPAAGTGGAVIDRSASQRKRAARAARAPRRR